MKPWVAGTQLGPYKLLLPIGAGGMGEVWKVQDTRLGRVVAIKRLKAEHTERLKREARAIAALNHPHICTLHDVGPDYLVMEYVDGTQLQRPLPVDEAVRLAIQIADALEEAHSRGVIHRDLKPGNVMVTWKGTAKLLDFGLAKLDDPSPSGEFSGFGSTVTAPGGIVGTVAYMSPEQVQGQAIDARSDIFSFGMVLYEMVSGRHAFPGDTSFEIMSAIVKEDPLPLQAPPGLERIIRRCLAKKPAERFQTASEVRRALEKIPVKASKLESSIAVLPFANRSGDKEQEYFSDGLAEEIINALTRIPDLKVTARTSAFAFRGKEQDITKIAEALRVRTVLEGSVRRAGNRIRVTAQLINAEDGYHLWSGRYDREMADIFAIQDEIAQAIATALELRLSAKPARIQQHTPTLPAYEALLKGRHHLFKFSPESWARAKECFEQAIALDPLYPQPHTELGLGYLFTATNAISPLRDVAHLARDEAWKALELEPSEEGPHSLLGAVAAAYDYDWKEAAEQFRVAMSVTPVPANTRLAYASYYLCPFGRFREAAAEMQSVVEQDPLNVFVALHPGQRLASGPDS